MHDAKIPRFQISRLIQDSKIPDSIFYSLPLFPTQVGLAVKYNTIGAKYGIVCATGYNYLLYM